MIYLATKLTKPEIIQILESKPITPNSLCVVCLISGESIVVNNSEYNDRLLRATGKFYEKEISDNGWLLIQIDGNYSILGDASLCPVNLL